MKLVTIDNEEIRLCSGMEEESFGKTNYDSIVTQEGIIASCDSMDNGKYHFTFSPWTFSEIKSLREPVSDKYLVYYCGKNPFSNSSKTLLEYFETAGQSNATTEDKDKMFQASFIICSILTQAAEENKMDFPINGAGGIIINLNDDKPNVLFLPPNLFKYSSASLNSVDNANNHTCWVNPTLFGLTSICFERASIVYKMLTGKFAYPSSNATERNADILDRKFLPLELCVNGIDKTLAQETNKALKLNSNEVAIPGKKKKGKSNEDLTPTASFPLEKLLNAKETLQKTISDEDFEAKAQTYIKNQTSKINTKRTIRRNKTIIITSVLGVILLTAICVNSIKSNRENYTSKGLTSTDTVAAYFKGVNDLDTVFLDSITKGRKVGHYVDTVSQMFVISKQRQAYGGHKGFLSPEKWLFYATTPQNYDTASLYGVTNVRIDGKLSELNPNLYKINQKPAPLTEENGIPLTEETKSIHSVEYYFLHTEGDATDIYLQKITETFTLTYIKNKWLITDIETESEDIPFDTKTFKSDYFESIKLNDGNVIQAIHPLRNKYEWLPSDEILLRELHHIEKAKNDILSFLE